MMIQFNTPLVLHATSTQHRVQLNTNTSVYVAGSTVVEYVSTDSYTQSNNTKAIPKGTDSV